MIDLYVIAPDDKEGVEIDFDNKSTNDVMLEVVEMCKKNHLDISDIKFNNIHGVASEKSITLTYLNGSIISVDLNHGEIAFVDENKIHCCSEADLEERFGLTTDICKANQGDEW
ncbi:MAG: hypothetical protein RSE18_00320 [Acinetobacter sp.]